MEEIIFPNQIRMFRRLRGRSMQELADHLGVSLSAISKIEKGYRRVDQERCRNCLSTNKIRSRKSSSRGAANRKEETRLTRKAA